jgi:predicted RNA-binding Zn ribbon-like protein
MPAAPPIRSWVLPDEPAPVRLMSTIWADAEGIHDDLAGPADLDAWLNAVGINCHGAKATQDELRSAIRLRDAVRRLAAHATGDHRPAAASAITDLDEAVTVLNEHAAKLPPPAIAASPSGLRLAKQAPASAVTTSLAGIAQQAVALLANHKDKLRACHAPGCVLYFVKTHPRRGWCSVACGNRARAARHYDKIREGRGALGVTAAGTLTANASPGRRHNPA